MAIILVLAGVVMAIVPGVMRRNKVVKTKAVLETVRIKLESSMREKGYYPLKDPAGSIDAVSLGLSVTSEPVLDGFDQPVMYRCPSVDPDKRPFDLWSIGADGTSGTDDDIHLGD